MLFKKINRRQHQWGEETIAAKTFTGALFATLVVGRLLKIQVAAVGSALIVDTAAVNEECAKTKDRD